MAEAREKPLPAHGGARKSNENKDVEQGDVDITLKSSRGGNPSYLARRIVRDHPDIAQKAASGAYTSVQEMLRHGAVQSLRSY